MLLGVVVALASGAAQARRARRAPARTRPATPPSGALGAIGQPRVVVVYRHQVAAFARTAEVLKRISHFPVTTVPLDPRDPQADLREDIEDAKPRIVVALGPMAARTCARGFGDVAVVFAYRSSPPKTTIRRGGWLQHGARPRDVLRWLRRLRPGLTSIGGVLSSPRDPLVRRLRRAARRLGIEVHLAFESRAGSPLRALAGLLKERPGAIWLGRDVEPWSALQLRGARRLQALFRVPVVGITAEHARRGLALAIDCSPDAVAKALESFIRAHVRTWLRREPPEETSPPPERHRRRRAGRRRRRRARPRRRPRRPVEAASLARGRVPARRVTLNARRVRAIGLDPRKAVAAGAIEVHQ